MPQISACFTALLLGNHFTALTLTQSERWNCLLFGFKHFFHKYSSGIFKFAAYCQIAGKKLSLGIYLQKYLHYYLTMTERMEIPKRKFFNLKFFGLNWSFFLQFFLLSIFSKVSSSWYIFLCEFSFFLALTWDLAFGFEFSSCWLQLSIFLCRFLWLALSKIRGKKCRVVVVVRIMLYCISPESICKILHSIRKKITMLLCLAFLFADFFFFSWQLLLTAFVAISLNNEWHREWHRTTFIWMLAIKIINSCIVLGEASTNSSSKCQAAAAACSKCCMRAMNLKCST